MGFTIFSSGIKNITIPDNVSELPRKWCKHVDLTPEIFKSENNRILIIYEEGMIVGKSNKDINVYDILYFVPRNVKQVFIPYWIKKNIILLFFLIVANL